MAKSTKGKLWHFVKVLFGVLLSTPFLCPFAVGETTFSSGVGSVATKRGVASVSDRWRNVVQAIDGIGRIHRRREASLRQIDTRLYLHSIRRGIIGIRGGHNEEQNDDKPVDIVIGIDGGTESIRACCFDARTGRILGSPKAVGYATTHPEAGWAEQWPEDWYDGLVGAVRGAVGSLDGDLVGAPIKDGGGREGRKTYKLLALCCDTTCCSVVALSKSYEPLMPCLLWMDARSAGEAKTIMEVARETAVESVLAQRQSIGNTHTKLSEEELSQEILRLYPQLRVNSAGRGPISAEWLLPKSLWIKSKRPEIWKEAGTICEYQDYVNYRLTGKMVASACNAAVRWHCDGWEVLDRDDGGNVDDGTHGERQRHRGKPLALYEALSIAELADKLPPKTLAMGEPVGGLTEESARDLGLPEGTMVVQGGPDAFVGMIGLGAIRPHQLCLITGSSHLHCLITPYTSDNPNATPPSSPGMWGAYRGAPLPHLNFAEGGQSSTGSLIRWVRDLISSERSEHEEKVSYKVLDDEAAKVPPGCDGLVALETWQGSRTPTTDPLARGALVGLTLSHTRAHIVRAILESVCFGTRACFDALEEASFHSSNNKPSTQTIQSNEENVVIVAGGATRSPLWIQLHADITGRTFIVNENTDGPLLGCAILASVGAGVYGSVEEAVDKMVRRERRIEPQGENSQVYDRLYREVYSKLRPGVKDVVHALANVRGGAQTMMDADVKMTDNGDSFDSVRLGIGEGRVRQENGSDNKKSKSRGNWALDLACHMRGGSKDISTKINGRVTISPSLLACDWSDMKGEIQKCLDAGVPHLHVDIFDGVFLDSPHALTFGPQMVEAIRRRFSNLEEELILDIHLCVERPQRYAKPLADAKATRLIFQWEAMADDEKGQLRAAMEFAGTVTSLGMRCGVSINPLTPVSDIFPLLDSELIDLVDILAVEPGFGGQAFNPVAIQKIAQLRTWRDGRLLDRGLDLKILVDGGIKRTTSRLVVDAGADILVAGTALFQHPKGFSKALKELLH